MTEAERQRELRRLNPHIVGDIVQPGQSMTVPAYLRDSVHSGGVYVTDAATGQRFVDTVERNLWKIEAGRMRADPVSAYGSVGIVDRTPADGPEVALDLEKALGRAKTIYGEYAASKLAEMIRTAATKHAQASWLKAVEEALGQMEAAPQREAEKVAAKDAHVAMREAAEFLRNNG
jgi:hypothetical protein